MRAVYAAPAALRSPRWAAGWFIALAFLIAAGATFWGSFGKIQSYKRVFPATSSGNGEYRYEMTWWHIDEQGASAALPRSWFPPYGVLLAAAGGLLIVVAVLAVTAAAGRRPGLVTGIRVGASVAVGVLAGAAALRLLDALGTLDQVNGEKLDPGESVDFNIGLGLYLPGGAALLGAAALLLTLNRGRAGRVEPDTPRMGFPMPYNPMVQQPYQTQQPTSQPFPAQQQPPSQPFPAQQPPTPPVAEGPAQTEHQ